jgi:hypothetical protein
VVPGAAVRDAGRGDGRRDPAGQAPGDVGRRDQVAVAGQPAVRAAEHPAARLGDPGPAARAGRGGAPLIGQGQGDTGLLSLVTQHGDQVADPPVAGPPVVPPPRINAQHATRVAHGQGADPARDGPADHGAGGLVLGLADPALVPRLDQPLAAPVVPPAAGSALPGFRGAPGHGPAPRLGVFEVQVVLSADRPPGDQQCLPVGPGDGVGVDDAQVHPGHPPRDRLRTRGVCRDRDLGGHVHPQPACVIHQGDRPDLAGRVRQLPVQADP